VDFPGQLGVRLQLQFLRLKIVIGFRLLEGCLAMEVHRRLMWQTQDRDRHAPRR